MRIVVADDQGQEASRLARLLTSLGHEVTVVVDGLAAANACLSDPPQVAFLDLLLPGLDGFEVARRIKASPDGRRGASPRSGPKLVAITGLRSTAAEEVARSVGFEGFLHKPYTVEDVKAILAIVAPLAPGPPAPAPGGQPDGS